MAKMEIISENTDLEKIFGHCIINWTIENFCLMTCKKESLIHSPDFFVKGHQLTKWKMILNPRTNEDHILFYLERQCCEAESRSIWANFKVSFIVKQRSLVVEEHIRCFPNNTNCMIDMHELEYVLDHIHPLDSDELTVQCQLLIYDGFSFTESDLAIDKGLVSLSEDLRLIYIENFNYDIFFKIDEYCMGAHKAILYFRNRKLAEIIGKEKGKQCIELPHVNYDAMNTVFDYLYSGNKHLLLSKPSISLYECILFLDIDELMCHYAPEQVKLHTIIEMEEICYFWLITDFDDRMEVVSPNLNSEFSDSTWRLHVYRVGPARFNQNIALTAEMVDGITPKSVCFEFGVMDAKKEFLLLQRVRRYIKDNKTIGSNYFIKTGEKNNEFLFKESVLRTVVKIRMFTGVVSTSSECHSMNYIPPYKRNSYELLSEDMKRALTSQKLSDIEFQIEGRYFKAHKCILTARSSFFKELISKKSEHITEKDFPNINPDVMCTVLYYIYCGTLENRELDYYSQLYKAAEFLKISRLRKFCSRILRKRKYGL